MKKALFALLLLAVVGIGFAGCSSDSDDEPTYTFQKIKGRWYQTAYLNSSKYFTAIEDGSYIEFGESGYVYYDASLKDTETGTFTFDKSTDEVFCRTTYKGREREWKATIQFETNDKATFVMTGIHNSTIKAERKTE